jgi:hypothetical protein
VSKTTWHPCKQTLFALLSAADFGLTWWLIDQTDGHAYEANPVAGWMLAQAGWLGLACFKAAVVAVVLAISAVVSRFRPAAAGRLLMLGCACLGAVVCYSSALAATAPLPVAFDADGIAVDPAVDEINGQIAEGNRHKVAFRALLDELMGEMGAGRITLDHAADRLAGSGAGKHPYWVKVMTDLHPDWALPESFAYYLLRHVVINSRSLPAPTAWKTALRMEREFQDAYGTTPPLDHREHLRPMLDAGESAAPSSGGTPTASQGTSLSPAN